MRSSPLVNVMISAARKAGRSLARDFNKLDTLRVSQKGPGDFVSEADMRAEEILIEELSQARPNFSILSEERGLISNQDTSNRFIIDPLDGTTNFLRGIGHFAVSIALERDGQPFAGVVYNPITDELYEAEKGKGAMLNGRRIRISPCENLHSAVLTTGIPHSGRGNVQGYLTSLNQFMDISLGIRRFGAAALDLAFVASAKADGFWEYGLAYWDVAAGIVLINEAGGRVEIDRIEPDTHRIQFTLAGCPPIFEEMKTRLERAK